MKPPIVILCDDGAVMKTCARCNLSRPDDGRRFKIHGGTGFICAVCKPRTS